MNLLEKLYGPRKKTRGSIEDGYSAKIADLQSKIESNKLDLQPTINKVDNIENTIDTKIGNYLEDNAKTNSLSVQFREVSVSNKLTAPGNNIFDSNNMNINTRANFNNINGVVIKNKISIKDVNNDTKIRLKINSENKGILEGNLISLEKNIFDRKTIENANEIVNLIGTIAYFPLEDAPLGWLNCDGKAYSIKTSDNKDTIYKKLYDVIKYKFGRGEGTKFRVPDLRGVFIRSLNNTNVGIDKNRSIEQVIQQDLVKNHKHLIDEDGEHTHNMNRVPDHKHTIGGGKHNHTMEEEGEHIHGIETYNDDYNMTCKKDGKPSWEETVVLGESIIMY